MSKIISELFIIQIEIRQCDRCLKEQLFIRCLHWILKLTMLTSYNSLTRSVGNLEPLITSTQFTSWVFIIASTAEIFFLVNDNRCQVLQTSNSYVTTGSVRMFVNSFTPTCILNDNDACHKATKTSKTAKCDHFARRLFCCAKCFFVFPVSGMRR